ncbi:MAG: hypothetical protein M1827_005064 [Pycnora praestabilis]|nr:MAG: hypothetical protein M1827_005064 [Pycnora praestabilis]
MQRKKVAVVGSGCSGLGALWALKSTECDVHLYESGERLGGHTNTVKYEHGGQRINVDTGFIVLNTATYPNFIAFLKEVGVPTVATDMTFGVSRDQGLFEWAGTSLSAVFAQRQNIISPKMWHMIFDIIRFNQYALDLLTEEEESEEDPSGAGRTKANYQKPRRQESIGEYLQREGYSEGFRDDYLIPMTAAVWSTSADKASLEFPAVTLVRFLWNHHLLSTVTARPQWMTIKGGSKQYIDAILENFPRHRVHLGTAVESVISRQDGSVVLTMAGGHKENYDHVILATHGDQATELIREGASGEEIEIMSGFQTSKNVAVLHSDLALMPKRTVAWSSWNYMTKSSPKSSNVGQVCLTYWMNLLQHIPTSTFGDVLVTLNPLVDPKPELTQGRWDYNHPLYNTAAIRSQSLLPKIQNTRGISYAGAWTKYGFHEDGFSSGLKVAVEHLGATLPFEFVDSTFSRGRRPTLNWPDYVLRFVISMIRILIWVFGVISGAVPTSHKQEGHRQKVQ